MGLGSLFKWRRFTEQTKQALGAGVKDFMPTPNGRNNAMINEARKFAQQIKSLHHDLLVLDMQIDVSFATTKGVLSAQLPRVFENAVDGALPTELEAGIVGQGVALDTITAATVDMRYKLQQEVLFPLEQWLSAYRTIKLRNKKTESTRLELDVLRRDKASQEDKLARLRILHDTLPDHKKGSSQNKIERAEDKLANITNQVARLTARYTEIESEVYNALLTLIKDTAVLKQYAAAGFFIFQRCFATAYGAFDLSIPQYSVATPAPIYATGADGASTSAALTTSVATTPSGKRVTKDYGIDSAASPATGESVRTPDQTYVVVPTKGAVAVSTPSWYNDAKAQPVAVNYDSEEEEGLQGKRPNNFATGAAPVSAH